MDVSESIVYWPVMVEVSVIRANELSDLNMISSILQSTALSDDELSLLPGRFFLIPPFPYSVILIGILWIYKGSFSSKVAVMVLD